MKNIIDVLIFGGQSNMQGQTESLPEANKPVEGALEYRFLSDELVPLCHPVGETVGENLLLGADSGHGSLIPDCCQAYVESTGHSVVAIHAAKGATTVAEWLRGTPRYDASVDKIRGGIAKAKELGEVGRIYYLWLQGESDAIIRTSRDDYARMLTEYKNDLMSDVGIDRFGIIEVGYFCGAVSWITDRTREEALACDEEIMAAQEMLVREDSDFVMLTDICKRLSLEEEHINPFVEGHYNNKAMALIGCEAGAALGRL